MVRNHTTLDNPDLQILIKIDYFQIKSHQHNQEKI